MNSIIKGTVDDARLLADIARLSFIASHGNSASDEEIERYVGKNFSLDTLRNELNNPENIFHIIFDYDQPAGYSKIIYDVGHPKILHHNITKLERIYLLEAYYGSGAGSTLLDFNLSLSREKEQLGMWLYVWKENQRAIRFYHKNHFQIIGSHDFKLSETHANPNYLMFLKY